MTGDQLKLTAFFGERLRSRNRFLADALIDLYAETEVASSLVLRGIASFGPHHRLRSDELLSMSEDPPIVVVAVDSADKIGPLADQVVAITPRGLVTVERASVVEQPEATGHDAVKLTVYLGRRDRVGGQPAHRAICDALHRHGFAGASVFLGVDGTYHGLRQRAHFFSRNVDVPQMVVAVGAATGVDGLTAELQGILPNPNWTVERVQLCKRDGRLLTRPATLPATDDDGRPLWQKLMVYTSEATHHDGAPIHRALVRRLMESGAVNGATAVRGVWGFFGDHRPHGDKFFQLSRRVPVTTIVVDSPQRIAAAFEIVDELTARHGLVTSELVPALVSIDNGERRGSTRLARLDR